MAASTMVAMCAGAAFGGPTTIFRLHDHPGAIASPPPYGLRFDGLFGNSNTTTFSIDQGMGDTLLTVEDTGGEITINIHGVLFGGEVSGNSYTANAGMYEVDFTYRMNVEASGTGWIVTDQSPSNNGTITALTGPQTGNTFEFSDKAGAPPGHSFAFLQDNHRLGGHSQFGEGFWVGRGWLMGDGSGEFRDWLFLGKIIPLPGAAGLALGGLGLMAVRRRR